jgi:hypothetical protein
MIRNGATSQMPCWFSFHASNHAASSQQRKQIMKFRHCLLVPLLCLIQIDAVMADGQVKLFKFVTAKDEVIVGITADELQKLGTGPELDNLAHHIAESGEMTIWQYAVRHDPSGNLQQAPLKRIAVFKNDTLRIEPYSSPLPVVAPDK